METKKHQIENELAALISKMVNGNGWADLSEWTAETVVVGMKAHFVEVAAGGPAKNLRLKARGRKFHALKRIGSVLLTKPEYQKEWDQLCRMRMQMFPVGMFDNASKPNGF